MSELKSSMVGMMISISNSVMLLLKSDYSNYISIVLLNPTLFISSSWTGISDSSWSQIQIKFAGDQSRKTDCLRVSDGARILYCDHTAWMSVITYGQAWTVRLQTLFLILFENFVSLVNITLEKAKSFELSWFGI